MAITAVLFAALMPTPQFSHTPPEKLASELLPLVRVVRVDPVIKSTLLLFSVQTTSPVTELEAHEFTSPVVVKFCAVDVPSRGTSSMPVSPPSQYPNGTYAFTFVPAVIASELVGTHAASVVLVAVTTTVEQLLLANAGLVPVTHTA